MAHFAQASLLVPLLLLLGVVVLVLLWLRPMKPFIAAWSAGVPVRMVDVVAMRMRGTPPRVVIDPLIAATQAGIAVDLQELEAHSLAGGNISKVVEALITAKASELDLPFQRAAAIDLAGRDVLEAIESAARPRDIAIPRLRVAAGDGIPLLASARARVRTDLDRLVGGADEETLVKRISEAIRDTIASTADHKTAVNEPKAIAQSVREQNLDDGTVLEVLHLSLSVQTERLDFDS